MEYPIPKHIKDFFQLVGTNNNEFEAKGNIKCSCCSEAFIVYQSNDKMIVKLICQKCNKEIIIFDEGRHGWNCFVCKDDFLDRAQPFEKVICEKCEADTFGVLVMISSQGKQDFIDECTSNDDSFTEDDWVDGFEWINISLRCVACDYTEEWMECETM